MSEIPPGFVNEIKSERRSLQRRMTDVFGSMNIGEVAMDFKDNPASLDRIPKSIQDTVRLSGERTKRIVSRLDDSRTSLNAVETDLAISDARLLHNESSYDLVENSQELKIDERTNWHLRSCLKDKVTGWLETFHATGDAPPIEIVTGDLRFFALGNKLLESTGLDKRLMELSEWTAVLSAATGDREYSSCVGKIDSYVIPESWLPPKDRPRAQEITKEFLARAAVLKEKGISIATYRDKPGGDEFFTTIAYSAAIDTRDHDLAHTFLNDALRVSTLPRLEETMTKREQAASYDTLVRSLQDFPVPFVGEEMFEAMAWSIKLKRYYESDISFRNSVLEDPNLRIGFSMASTTFSLYNEVADVLSRDSSSRTVAAIVGPKFGEKFSRAVQLGYEIDAKKIMMAGLADHVIGVASEREMRTVNGRVKKEHNVELLKKAFSGDPVAMYEAMAQLAMGKNSLIELKPAERLSILRTAAAKLELSKLD